MAVDLGTGGPKVAVMTMSGEAVATAFVATPLIHTDDGGIEQDAAGWWRAIAEASVRATSIAPEAARAVRAVAIASQWMATVAIDEHGAPLMNAISWMDGRGARHAAAVCGPRPRVFGYNPFKLARWLRVAGGAPSLAGHDSLAHLHLIRDLHPDVYERTHAFIDPGGYIGALLTGRIATSAESACSFWATDNRKIDAIAYDDRLVRIGGLDRARLPEVVPSGNVLGDLLPARAAELGIGVVPVVAATPDITAAALGSGAVEDFAAHLYVGTSGWLACHMPRKKIDPLHNIAALPSALRGRYLMCTEQQCAGEALAHLRTKLLGIDLGFDDLIAEATERPAGADGVLFTPWLNGERTPLDDKHVRAAYANVSLTSTRGSLVRATLEGVAHNVRWMHECCERFTGRRLDSIAAIGGGAQSGDWCQIFADVLDREVRQIADPRQATARGAALLGAMALGELDRATIPERVTATATYTPNPATRALYDDRFGRFKDFYKANRKLYRKLNGGRRA